MIAASSITDLLPLRRYFDSGVTRSYKFRREKLILLKKAVQQHETEIAKAIFKDLKRGQEEVYGTETGLLISEISNALKNLLRWMEPRDAGTNLVNLPGSSKIYRDPLGVVLIIGAWNYPVQLALIPLVGAIAGGNCAVIKPSEVSTASAVIIQKILESVFEPQYIKVVQGDGSEVIPEMMNRFRFDHVFYTGSIPVGKAIYKLAAEQLIPVTLELGGKCPAIVEPDARLELAAKRIALAKFINAGQTCIAPDYVLVHESVKEPFIQHLKNSITKFFSDNPATNEEYGKIINTKRFDVLVSYLESENIIYGGRHDRELLRIDPTLIDMEADSSSPIMKEEIFGPILPIITYRNFEEARSIVEWNKDPLALYLFTESNKTEKRWMQGISFGGGCVNNAAWHFSNHYIPFGGIGNSGIGSYHGQATFNTFTHAKAVMKTATWIDPSIKYPPFRGKLKWFKRFFR